jgi:hypothetical protein
MPTVDAYTFRARMIPIFLVCLPPVVLLCAGIISGTRLGIATGATVTMLGALAGQLGRDRGKALELGLWRAWGGSPTLQALRLRGAPDVDDVQRRHARIARLIDEPFPSRDQELANPDAADRAYDRITRRLIGLTRDHQRFPLVLAENINYGQRRNLLGLRTFGIATASLTLVAAATLLILSGGDLSTWLSYFAPGASAGMLALMLWTVVVDEAWVRVPAEAYADRLLEAVDVIALDTTPVAPSPFAASSPRDPDNRPAR